MRFTDRSHDIAQRFFGVLLVRHVGQRGPINCRSGIVLEGLPELIGQSFVFLLRPYPLQVVPKRVDLQLIDVIDFPAARLSSMQSDTRLNDEPLFFDPHLYDCIVLVGFDVLNAIRHANLHGPAVKRLLLCLSFEEFAPLWSEQWEHGVSVTSLHGRHEGVHGLFGRAAIEPLLNAIETSSRPQAANVEIISRRTT